MIKKIVISLLVIGMMGCAQIKRISPFSHPSDNSTISYTNGYEKSTSYDFPDIPIPKELKLDVSRSIVFESPRVKLGVLVYKGRVDALSLFEYFVKKLPEYNWKLRSYFKYGRYIVLFSKQDKDLVIRIKDKGFTTEATLWVVPRTKEGIDSSGTSENSVHVEEIKP